VQTGIATGRLWRPVFERILVLGAALTITLGGVQAAEDREPVATGQIIRQGVVVDFEAYSLGADPDTLMEGQLAEIRVRLTEEASGAPVTGVTPGVWMDIGSVIQGQPGAEVKQCKDKIALYLKGVVGIRPMLDLNSYYIIVMNKEPSLSIVDPLVSMVGKTSTLGVVPLKSPGADWVASEDDKRLFVTLPKSGLLAVVDTDTFKVAENVKAGAEPSRVAMQPDGRYVWVGNNGTEAGQSGVTVVDAESFEALGFIATGEGHHEIAFSGDSRYAFVSNRLSGTVSVIDVATRQKVKDIASGPTPISLAYSSLSRALYVSDGQAGTVSVIDGQSLEPITRITLKPGLGPMRFTNDGRWGLVVNPSADKLFVVDAASNALLHTLDVQGKPYQVVVSEAFAYVRSLQSERVTMVNLKTLGEGQTPIVQGISAGNVPPMAAGDLALADSVSQASTEAAMLIVNPADNTTYFYMEGMNAPSSNYKVFGGSARAVTVVDRSLKEVAPGIYSSKIKIPAAGRYDVAFTLETPQILHCFSATAEVDPDIRKVLPGFQVDFLDQPREVTAGQTLAFRFKLVDPLSGLPIPPVSDAQVMFYRAPSSGRTVVQASHQGDGVYLADLPIPATPGAYYIHVGASSMGVAFKDLTYYSVVALPPRSTGN